VTGLSGGGRLPSVTIGSSCGKTIIARRCPTSLLAENCSMMRSGFERM
jgi:hypothetical protein